MSFRRPPALQFAVPGSDERACDADLLLAPGRFVGRAALTVRRVMQQTGGIARRLRRREGEQALAIIDQPSADPIKHPDRPRLADVLGPGLITGASDDDPSGIATYSQAGAQFGFSLIWTLLLTYPLMCAIQMISAEIGRVTGKGIAANMRRCYPAYLLYSMVGLLVLANVINIGADLGAMAAALRLILPGPQWAVRRGVRDSYRGPGSVHALCELRFRAEAGSRSRFSPMSRRFSSSAFRGERSPSISSFHISSGRRAISPSWWPSSARRSAPISSFGRPPRKSRTKGRIRPPTRFSRRRPRRGGSLRAFDSTLSSEWALPTSSRSSSF